MQKDVEEGKATPKEAKEKPKETQEAAKEGKRCRFLSMTLLDLVDTSWLDTANMERSASFSTLCHTLWPFGTNGYMPVSRDLGKRCKLQRLKFWEKMQQVRYFLEFFLTSFNARLWPRQGQMTRACQI